MNYESLIRTQALSLEHLLLNKKILNNKYNNKINIIKEINLYNYIK